MYITTNDPSVLASASLVNHFKRKSRAIPIFCFPVNEQWAVAIPKAFELVSTVLFAACVLTYQTKWQACLWALQCGWSAMVVFLTLKFPDDEYQLNFHLLFLKICCFDVLMKALRSAEVWITSLPRETHIFVNNLREGVLNSENSELCWAFSLSLLFFLSYWRSQDIMMCFLIRSCTLVVTFVVRLDAVGELIDFKTNYAN